MNIDSSNQEALVVKSDVKAGPEMEIESES
jgi:hypothetical protein